MGAVIAATMAPSRPASAQTMKLRRVSGLTSAEGTAVGDIGFGSVVRRLVSCISCAQIRELVTVDLDAWEQRLFLAIRSRDRRRAARLRAGGEGERHSPLETTAMVGAAGHITRRGILCTAAVAASALVAGGAADRLQQATVPPLAPQRLVPDA